MRLFHEQIPAVVWTTDIQLRFTFFSGAGLATLKLPPDELLGEDLWDDHPWADEDAPTVTAAHRRALRGESVTCELRMGDRVHWLSVEPLRDSGGTLIGCLAVAVDITERKPAETEQERLIAQLQADRESLRQMTRMLEEERYILQAVEENTDAQIAYLDPQFNFVHVNSAYVQGSGHRREELIGRNHFELFPHAENQAIFERARDTGEAVTVRAKPFKFPDRPELGTTYWDWTLTPVKDDRGRVRGMVLSLVDVTERERSRRTLQRHAERLTILHEADQAILAAQSVGEIAASALRRVPNLVDCLQASVVEFHPEANEMVLLAVHARGESHLGPGWRSPVTVGDWLVEKLAQGQVHTVEDIQDLSLSSPLIEALRADGVRAYVYVPLVAQGSLIGFLNLGMAEPSPLTPEEMQICRELADQLAVAIRQARLAEHVEHHVEQLEEQVTRRTRVLQERGARLRAIVDNAPVGIAVVDMQGRILETNPALRAMLGYDADELHGMQFVDVTHSEDREADLDLYHELIAAEGAYHGVERRYVRKDGQVRWGNLSASIVRGPRSTGRFAIGLVEDITERKRAQQAVVQAERLALTGRLAASLAHEINNPLQSVVGCIGLAEESLAEGDEQDARELLQIATEELERAAGIVNQLRNLSRRSRPEEREPTDVNVLLEQVLMLTRRRCQNRQIEVIWQPADDLPSLMLVPDRLRQVFLNLVLNAVEALPDGGRLEVGMSPTSESAGVCISFADSGPGIAPEDLPHIFEPFYTTKPEGLGLGLYVTQNIVEEHGGRIEVDSRLGEGTTFAVWLPA